MVDTLLHLDQISKSFPGVLALDRASLELKAGEIHGRVGENGAGKSTLVNALMGEAMGDDEKLLPKDAPGGDGGGGGGGGAKDAGGGKGDFKVDERIKKGRHVKATNENYMTLAGLGKDDELLPKDK